MNNILLASVSSTSREVGTHFVSLSKLHTAKILLKGSDAKSLETIAVCWRRLAEDLEKEASCHENKMRLAASSFVLRSIVHKCQDIDKWPNAPTLCYFAYVPEKQQLEGIGTGFFGNHAFYLNSLVTHPKNIAPNKYAKRVSEVGKALIAHICQDINTQSSKQDMTLNLLTLQSAHSFYENLGFVESEAFWKGSMTLTHINRVRLINKYQDISMQEAKPPSFSKLTF
jgi:hypothetical protein